MSIQWNDPLTVAHSPSDGADGERESFSMSNEPSLFGDHLQRLPIFSLSPSGGERAGVRGFIDCMGCGLGRNQLTARRAS
jgi:hypothetical protein